MTIHFDGMKHLVDHAAGPLSNEGRDEQKEQQTEGNPIQSVGIIGETGMGTDISQAQISKPAHDDCQSTDTQAEEKCYPWTMEVSQNTEGRRVGRGTGEQESQGRTR